MPSIAESFKGARLMGALDGKVAVISGGTSGIGARAAELFVNGGARVVIAARRRERGEDLAARLGTCSFHSNRCFN
jgi:NAD(P)-dependent dehydrogenase (short-subunit alcohol dehydrogenase family)